MPRSVNSVASRARRKKILKQAKGYFGRRKNVWTVAKNAVEKAMLYAYRDRRTKKTKFQIFMDRQNQCWCKRARNVIQPVYGQSKVK